MDNDIKFKLKTRRALAWGAVGVAVATCSFVCIYSLMFVSGCQELASQALGILGTSAGFILGFYFGKKAKDE